MSRIINLLKNYKSKSKIDFLRYLLIKERSFRIDFKNKIKSGYHKQIFKGQITKFGKGINIGPQGVRILKGENGKICVGDNVTFYSPNHITCTDHIFPESIVEIGDRTRIGPDSAIRAAKKIVIGKDCLIARYVRIYDYNGHPLNPGCYDDFDSLRNRSATPQDEVSEINIGDNVWIGENAFIQRGVTIGSGSIISANSVVIKNVPKNTVVFGVPARPILWLDKKKSE